MSANDFHGFQHPARHARRLNTRKTAFAELIMTLALVICIAVVATAVTIGMARADALAGSGSQDGSALAIAAFLGSLIAVMGGITALSLHMPERARRD
ncbi:MAG: hypothetical protein HXY30_05255 [Pseudorhodoplanes sp.]|nr:hypothetical protein [Pseudorhodoplanes sp.]